MGALDYDIVADDLSAYGSEPALVTFGEVMVRDTPADERLERARTVRISMAGSEYAGDRSARLGLRTVFVTRVPDNPTAGLYATLLALRVLTPHIWSGRRAQSRRPVSL